MDWNGRKQFVAAAIKAFPDIAHHILDIVAEGVKVAVRFKITGTHKGEFQGIPPTGKEVSIDGTDFLTIIDGKIVEEWLNSDMMGLMQQIGGIPTPPSAASGSSTAHS
jgi:predicted ester cyclase